jgi:predicted RNA binding protein YcfA (HicA-like mRNA interferase family)
MKIPRDAPKQKVIKTLETLGFKIVRVRKHISIVRENPDGTKTPLTMPKHKRVKGSTLRLICRQARIKREDFLRAYVKKHEQLRLTERI